MLPDVPLVTIWHYNNRDGILEKLSGDLLQRVSLNAALNQVKLFALS